MGLNFSICKMGVDLGPAVSMGRLPALFVIKVSISHAQFSRLLQSLC